MAELFDDLPEQRGPVRASGGGRARFREPVRDEKVIRICVLDALIGEEHPVRAIWAYAERLDLWALELQVKARDGVPGMPQTSFRLLFALWLYATTQGVGSARALARLCENVAAYQWLCGDVSVNHRLLGEFRRDQGALVERLLIGHVASLSQAGLVDLDVIAQDGVRVRASAGAASFRRRKTLESELKKSTTLVARLAKEIDEDPGASDRRAKANRERAARDRVARVEAALAAQKHAEALRAKRLKTNKAQAEKQKEPRSSTSDADARTMKMADGGFRPAYNVQFASDPASGVIVAVDCANVGSDRGLAEPMARRIAADYGARPKAHLVDGGYLSREDIDAADAAGAVLYCPPTQSKSGRDPYAARKEDTPAVAAWRVRMASPEGKAIYKLRCRCELPHARLRNLGLDHLLLRGNDKVLTWMRWFALAMNIMTQQRLLRAATA
jgi:transposase